MKRGKRQVIERTNMFGSEDSQPLSQNEPINSISTDPWNSFNNSSNIEASTRHTNGETKFED